MKNHFVLILMISMLFGSCATCQDPGSDEDQIQSLIRKVAELAEKHSLSDLMDLVTQDFSIQPKGWNRKQTKKVLFLLFYKLGEFSIHPTPDIVVNSDAGQASATVTLLLLRKGESNPKLEAFKNDPITWLKNVGNRYRLYRIQLEFLKPDDQWLLQQARHERFRGLGFGS